MKVGFIGLGEMGGAIATRIIEAGWPTVLWARRPEVLADFSAANVEIADTPAALAAETDMVGVCVWTDEDVRVVVAGDEGVLAGARPGTIVVIHSTALPSTCRELAGLAAPRGVAVVDAPVSGGRNVALAGALTVAVGGDVAAVARCKPVFEAYSETLVQLGGVGTGQIAKLLNNSLFAANLAVADDALTVGSALGIDPPALAQFLASGSGRSYGLEIVQRARTSAETRAAALPALAKDVESLLTETGDDCAAKVFHQAAAAAVDRLRDPPPGWLP